ncbi:MAG TPA: PIN domain-containing protein [Balneolales bacterium]|nr:PIN domain-containing protein [Balneolales bacterium]
MKVLIDTNVILDVFFKREPYFFASAQVVGLSEEGKIEGWIGATTITTIFYLLSKTLDNKRAVENVRKLLKIFHISSINRVVLEDALDTQFKDYEDAVLYQSAIHANLNTIVTRNPKDFLKSNLPVYTPKEYLALLNIL